MAETGAVPDDLPAPVRDALGVVAALRGAVAAAEDRAAKARAETLAAQEAAKRHHDELQALRSAPPANPEADKRIRELEREVKAAKRAGELRAGELADRAKTVAALEDQIRAVSVEAGNLRAGFALVAEAAGLPADAAPRRSPPPCASDSRPRCRPRRRPSSPRPCARSPGPNCSRGSSRSTARPSAG